MLGHSLGAGYALVTMDLALERGWGNESLFIALKQVMLDQAKKNLLSTTFPGQV